MTQKLRGFEEVVEKHRKHGKMVEAHGQSILLHPKVTLPIRADKRSAGYDFYTPVPFVVLPGQTYELWTNVKTYMQDDEYLAMYIRSSVGIKRKVTISHGTGIIDASFYENEENDGNIRISLQNNSGRAVEFAIGERIAQGVFQKYLVADDDKVLKDERTGGVGSSN